MVLSIEEGFLPPKMLRWRSQSSGRLAVVLPSCMFVGSIGLGLCINFGFHAGLVIVQRNRFFEYSTAHTRLWLILLTENDIVING